MIIKAIRAEIFESKSFGNCSNNGISARYGHVYIPHPYGCYSFDEDDLPENMCKIVRRGGSYVCLEPVARPHGIGWMSGGSLVYSSDSRFSDLSGTPLCLHDRCETQEEYNMLSM